MNLFSFVVRMMCWKGGLVKALFCIYFMLATTDLIAQPLTIVTATGKLVHVVIIDGTSKIRLIDSLNGVQDNSLRKKWTARTFKLTNGEIIVEFYNGQAVLIRSLKDFKLLEEVQFVINVIKDRIKNISYKIELDDERQKKLLAKEIDKQTVDPKEKIPVHDGYRIYGLKSGQLLLVDCGNPKTGIIYPDVKTLISDTKTILESYHDSNTLSEYSLRFANGDPLEDYEEGTMLLVVEEDQLMQYHRPELVVTDANYSDSSSPRNLYRIANGSYLLAEDLKGFTIARLYKTMGAYRSDQDKWMKEKGSNGDYPSEYNWITRAYGMSFLKHIPELINKLPVLLNFDPDQLSFDSNGLAIVDEALKWHQGQFEDWFPAVLAYYGEFYIANKGDGKWVMKNNCIQNRIVPEIELSDKSQGFDPVSFYQRLHAGYMPLKQAGDYEGVSRCRFLCDGLEWVVKKDVVYSLQIEEADLDSQGRVLMSVDGKGETRQPGNLIFTYPDCEILLHPVKADTFEMRIVNTLVPDRLLYEGKFSSKRELGFCSFTFDHYDVVKDIFIHLIYGYSPRLKRIIHEFPSLDFLVNTPNGYYGTRFFTSHDSAEYTIPHFSIPLLSVDKDSVASFSGEVYNYKIMQATGDNTADTNAISVRYKVNMDYAIRDRLINYMEVDIDVKIEAVLPVRKKIKIHIRKK